MTIQLPGGGSETIAYTGKIAPKVTFHSQKVAAIWPSPFSYNWMAPSFVGLDPVMADINGQLDILASTPLLLPYAPDQLLTAADLGNLPAGSSYSMMSETVGNGVCTRFTRVTRAAGDTKPKIVSRSSGNCGASSNVTSQPAQAARAVNLRASADRANIKNM